MIYTEFLRMSSSNKPASRKADTIEEELTSKLGRSVSSGALTISPELFEKVRSADTQNNIVFH